MDPRIRVCTKKSWIQNTASSKKNFPGLLVVDLSGYPNNTSPAQGHLYPGIILYYTVWAGGRGHIFIIFFINQKIYLKTEFAEVVTKGLQQTTQKSYLYYVILVCINVQCVTKQKKGMKTINNKKDKMITTSKGRV
jgi:hypothetical protein